MVEKVENEQHRKRMALYCRVSTDEQTTENQRLRLIDYANSQKWDYEIIEETETTRKTRPKKQELLQRLRGREFDGVCVFKLDRWARSSRELILEIEELTRKGVLFISISEKIDLSSPSGRLQFQILSAFAEFERALISERVKEGIIRMKAQGKPTGRKKGSKDTKPRRKSGYYMRWINKPYIKNKVVKTDKETHPEKEWVNKANLI